MQEHTCIPEIRIADSLLVAITERLTCRAPERGGAILGFDGLAHLLVEDDFGSYSPASWDISGELSHAVGEVETAGYGRLMGTVHTHPAGVCDPSGQDVRTTTKALEMNPHLDELLICVVTRGKPRDLDVPLPGGQRMSVHVLRRAGRRQPDLIRAKVGIVGLTRTLDSAGLQSPGAVSVTDVRHADFGQLLPVLRVNGHDNVIVSIPDTPEAVFIGAQFPDAAPLLVSMTDEGLHVIDPEPADAPTFEQLGDLVRERRKLQAPPPNDRLNRVVELVGSLNDKAVFIAGAGSVGSRIAEDLVRSGVGRISILDPEAVSAPNMARSVYTSSDIGRPKVDALVERLSGINPDVVTTKTRSTLLEADLPALLEGIDLVVLATDDMAEQAHLASLAYGLGIPQVASAMYRKAAAGEVVLVLPELRTPCWACCIGTSTLSTSERPDTNYGVDGQLVAESGLGASINLVTSVGSLLAIGLLAGPDSPAGRPLGRLLGEGRTLGIIATTPRWQFFDEVFETMAHQSHPQSIWPKVHSAPDCPVCGEPLDAVLTGPELSLAELVAVVDQDDGVSHAGF
jgi:molybdopterin/thiamine biosynthesis adenylyltransferase